MLTRLNHWARLTHHNLARRQAERMLASTSGDDFDVVRARVFELTYCPSPLDCDCLDAKPLRKVVNG